MIAEWLDDHLAQSHEALNREAELFLGDMRQATRFVVCQLPFGYGVLAAAQPEALGRTGGRP